MIKTIFFEIAPIISLSLTYVKANSMRWIL